LVVQVEAMADSLVLQNNKAWLTLALEEVVVQMDLVLAVQES
jgi:hypothetical protein